MRHQARIRNNRSQGLRDVVPDTRNGPNRNPQQIQPQVQFSKYNRIIKAGENAMNVVHGLLYALLGTLAQVGDNDHKIRQRPAVLVHRGSALAQRLRSIQKGK